MWGQMLSSYSCLESATEKDRGGEGGRAVTQSHGRPHFQIIIPTFRKVCLPSFNCHIARTQDEILTGTCIHVHHAPSNIPTCTCTCTLYLWKMVFGNEAEGSYFILRSIGFQIPTQHGYQFHINLVIKLKCVDTCTCILILLWSNLIKNVGKGDQ